MDQPDARHRATAAAEQPLRALPLVQALQDFLQRLYRIESGHRVTDFVITDRRLAAILDARGAKQTAPERLLLREGDDALELSLYLDARLLAMLPGHPDEPIRACQVDAFCKVLEGVSHFLYAVHRGSRDRPFSRLELELQAEVDKYATLATLIRHAYGTRPEPWLRTGLFERIRFDPRLETAELLRYRTANRYAARYCGRLERRYAWGWASADARKELRRFYRMGHAEKLRHIGPP